MSLQDIAVQLGCDRQLCAPAPASVQCRLRSTAAALPCRDGPSCRYGTNSVELLAAVSQLAGPQTGVTVLDRATVRAAVAVPRVQPSPQSPSRQQGAWCALPRGRAAD